MPVSKLKRAPGRSMGESIFSGLQSRKQVCRNHHATTERKTFYKDKLSIVSMGLCPANNVTDLEQQNGGRDGQLEWDVLRGESG